jgi:hypothetical protein
MVSEAGRFVWRWAQHSLARTLSLREAATTLALLATAGTIYCQIYCLLALQQLHGVSMPLLASVGRSSADVVPAFLAFEIGKRAIPLPRFRRWPAIAAIFAGALAFGLAIRLQVPMMSQTLTLRHMAVDRIPFLLLAAAALAFYAARCRSTDRASPP